MLYDGYLGGGGGKSQNKRRRLRFFMLSFTHILMSSFLATIFKFWQLNVVRRGKQILEVIYLAGEIAISNRQWHHTLDSVC